MPSTPQNATALTCDFIEHLPRCARQIQKSLLTWFLAFAQIKPAKINLSLFGRLSLPKVEDERRAVLLFGFDQDVVDVGLDGAHGKE